MFSTLAQNLHKQRYQSQSQFQSQSHKTTITAAHFPQFPWLSAHVDRTNFECTFASPVKTKPLPPILVKIITKESAEREICVRGEPEHDYYPERLALALHERLKLYASGRGDAEDLALSDDDEREPKNVRKKRVNVGKKNRVETSRETSSKPIPKTNPKPCPKSGSEPTPEPSPKLTPKPSPRRSSKEVKEAEVDDDNGAMDSEEDVIEVDVYVPRNSKGKFLLKRKLEKDSDSNSDSSFTPEESKPAPKKRNKTQIEKKGKQVVSRRPVRTTRSKANHAGN